MNVASFYENLIRQVDIDMQNKLAPMPPAGGCINLETYEDMQEELEHMIELRADLLRKAKQTKNNKGAKK